MDYYSAMTKKEILPFATTCMDLESNVLSEISQTEKGKINDSACMWNLKKNKNESKQITDQWLERQETGVREMDAGGHKVQTSGHKVNKF